MAQTRSSRAKALLGALALPFGALPAQAQPAPFTAMVQRISPGSGLAGPEFRTSTLSGEACAASIALTGQIVQSPVQGICRGPDNDVAVVMTCRAPQAEGVVCRGTSGIDPSTGQPNPPHELLFPSQALASLRQELGQIGLPVAVQYDSGS